MTALGKGEKMKKKVHYIMPMGGGGTRFGNTGFHVPKPLIEIHGKPFFYWATQSLMKYVEVCDLTFVVLQEHIDNFDIDKKILELYPQALIKVIPQVLNGAVLTCKEGAETIHDDLPIVFNDCDHMFISKEFNDFCNNGDFSYIDGAILTFMSKDPRYSFAKFDEEGYISRTVEKEAVSDEAICGVYYFKNRQIFQRATEKYLNHCQYKEFFVSGLYNEMAAEGLKSVSFPVDLHISFGTPEEYEEALNREEFEEFI